MNEKNIPRKLQEQWARAVERATEDKQDRDELDADRLNHAAGLHVQAGVQAGAWSGDCSNGDCYPTGRQCL